MIKNYICDSKIVELEYGQNNFCFIDLNNTYYIFNITFFKIFNSIRLPSPKQFNEINYATVFLQRK